MTATSVNYEKSHLGQKWRDGYDGLWLVDVLKVLPEPIDVRVPGIDPTGYQDDLDALARTRKKTARKTWSRAP